MRNLVLPEFIIICHNLGVLSVSQVVYLHFLRLKLSNLNDILKTILNNLMNFFPIKFLITFNLCCNKIFCNFDRHILGLQIL